jgi:hypothetical protein
MSNTTSTPADQSVDASVWLARFAAELGVAPPTREQIDALLGAAGVAAHASERIAAPLTCWLIGRVGVDVDQALVLAKELAAELAQEQSA